MRDLGQGEEGDEERLEAGTDGLEEGEEAEDAGVVLPDEAVPDAFFDECEKDADEEDDQPAFG